MASIRVIPDRSGSRATSPLRVVTMISHTGIQSALLACCYGSKGIRPVYDHIFG
jgi:hypothetical protein